MANHEDRENFIPFRKAEIVEMCCADGKLNPTQQNNFREFCKILESYYHFEHYELIEKLKNSYYPFNPDKDTKTKRTYSPDELKEMEKQFLDALTEVLEGANYEKVTQEDLKHAMAEQSLFTISLEVDFEDFTQFLVFKRGETTKKETLKKFFKTKEIEMDVYERVVLYIQFKDAEYFKAKGKKNLMFEPGSTILKLFKSIPKADIEMLFPNAETKMSRVDKMLMGLPAGIGSIPVLAKVIPSLIVLIGIILTSLGVKEATAENHDNMKAAIQGLIGLGILGGFLFKQWMKYKNKKLAFAKTLTDNLYFKNLDNNGGVFFHLIDSAEEEEAKEAVLAYYFLSTTSKPLTEEQLDNAIEQWFENKHGVKIDFEVDDAVGKLQRLEIGQCQNGNWSVLPLDKAKERIDEVWDNIFSYNS